MSTRPRTQREARNAQPYGRVQQAIDEMDERFGVAKGGRVFLDKIFPDHWSFMLGEIALYSFVVLVATGIFLTLYYVPSQATVIYHGPYKPLDGVRMSEAYQSSINLSFSVRAGLLMRQMHHWSADIFVGSIVVHMARIFFTGAFRKPRETNWIIGVTLLLLAVLNGFIGYSLPDDLVSGTGLRIGYSILLSIPFVGNYLAVWLWGGAFPGHIIIERLFIIHVLIIPLVILGLLGAHLGLLVRQKHTQFPGRGKTEHNVVGSPMFPTFMAKTTGFLLMVTGATALLGGLAQINPIWQFGPYQDPSKISYAVQPDWYMGWLDGALRIMPAWEWTGWGHTIPYEVLLPAVIFPGVIFNLCYAWPIVERIFTKDNEMHNLLDRPRDRPKRTAAGAAMLALLFTLFGASSTDVLANFFHVSLNEVLWFFRIATVVVPIVVGFATWRICREMQGVHGIGKRKRAMVVSRTAEGEYVAVSSEVRPGDEHDELEAEPVPVRIEAEPEPVGAGTVGDGAGVRRVAR
ncbi:MAG TPA: ubiquinol-cytochrome c reductase cytochrome b subunit [Acidimicrobiales bacterium]|nr:ubiquinol-cytochrome c reductase cytochrome b subunit [Acidimicrobiales bacterium]